MVKKGKEAKLACQASGRRLCIAKWEGKILEVTKLHYMGGLDVSLVPRPSFIVEGLVRDATWG
jgi:hypothetical protein